MPNENYLEESEQIKIIQEMQDPNEVEATIELLEERLSDEPEEEDTSSDEEIAVEVPVETDTTSEAEEDFIITQEFIEAQDEESKKILHKYLNKGKEEIAKAISHAIALKSPYIKDNPKIIEAIENEYKNKSNDELIKILVDTQKSVGRQDTNQFEKKVPNYQDIKIDFNSPEISQILEKEMISLLKEKYPSMPDNIQSFNDEEYKEWRRDLNIDEPDNTFIEDYKRIRGLVEDNTKKFLFVKDELKNLYTDNPFEIYERIKDADADKLRALKELNDNPTQVLFNDINEEISKIRNWLKQKYNLTENDIGIKLEIQKDRNGNPYNEVLNSLMVKKYPNGEIYLDPEVITTHAKVFWLNKDSLFNKFVKEYELQAQKTYFEKMLFEDKKKRQTLKRETLKEGVGTGSSSGTRRYTLEDIENINNPEIINKIIKELENR